MPYLNDHPSAKALGNASETLTFMSAAFLGLYMCLHENVVILLQLEQKHFAIGLPRTSQSGVKSSFISR